MANNTNNTDSGTSALSLIVGGLLVVVVVLGFLFYNGKFPGQTGGPSTSVSVEAPSMPAAPKK
jgi:ABC-type transporter Mla subunit MlaD